MVNKVILLGHVGKDPEIRHIDNNLVVARFPLATTERWNKDGNKMEHTEWHNIVMWRNLAETAGKYVRKGSLLYVEGRLRSKTYEDKDGIKRYSLEIVADTMQLGPKQPDRQTNPETSQVGAGLAPAPQAGVDNIEAPPDDLPF